VTELPLADAVAVALPEALAETFPPEASAVALARAEDFFCAASTPVAVAPTNEPRTNPTINDRFITHP
jgi:hypothetical protein